MTNDVNDSSDITLRPGKLINKMFVFIFAY